MTSPPRARPERPREPHPSVTTPSRDAHDLERQPVAPGPRSRPAVLEPGDKGEQVRELQNRLYQLAWLPE